jgi:type I restriction enzyme S subunit
MTKKSDAPAIRFKGFSDAWEQRKLSEITDKVTEKNAGLQYVETFTNSAEFGIISQRDFFDHDIAKLGSLDGYYIVKNEDFVYNPRISTSAPVGPINRNKLGRTGVMSPLYTVFRPHDIDTTYLEYFFKCGYWHSFMNFNGDSGARSDRFSIRDNVFFQMPIPIPDIDEQRKIGELLTCLDNLITLHQRKFEKLTNVKKSMLEKMFPQNGSSYPEIRFKGFTDPWEQRKLGDMMNVTSVKRIHQSDWTDSGVRFLRARDIVAAAKNEEPDDYLYISKEKYEEYSALSGKVGVSDLLVTGVGTIGVPYLVRNLEPLYFKDGNIIWFQNSDKIDGKFLFYSFSAEQIQGFINESAGIGTVGTYTIESGKKTPISLPNQIEQAKVGEFFQQLDNLITLHQRELEKLQNIKKSMLEKMFV